jgi:hypothetical protein
VIPIKEPIQPDTSAEISVVKYYASLSPTFIMSQQEYACHLMKKGLSKQMKCDEIGNSIRVL